LLADEITPKDGLRTRESVNGPLASLLTLVPDYNDKAQALEIAVGKHLHNAVIAGQRVGATHTYSHSAASEARDNTIVPLSKT
jgi:hypothetical protein